jgi:TonB family protein
MIALALKATVVLAAAWGISVALRRSSAAVRHFVWTAGLAAVLLLPLLSWAPQRETVIAPAIVVAAVTESAAAAVQQETQLPWGAILYGVGAALAGGWFLIGAARTMRMARRGTASEIGEEFGARVIFSAETAMPLAWGILRPVVILPTGAAEWPEARLRSVLLHEAMHHRRRDLLAQAIAQAACCLYWFHPLAWLALARQRAERERACDDAVLRQGVTAHDYATHLLEVVRTVAESRRRWSTAPAMADGSTLESRVRSVLDRKANRGPLSRRAAVGIAAVVVALLAPLGVVTVRAQVAGTISGVVKDPSGARVPGCKVLATNLDDQSVQPATANAAGEYALTGIPSGRYAVEFSAPGFARLKQQTTLVTGAAARVDANLEVGSTTESVTVAGRRSNPIVPAPRTAAPQRIPVGGNVQAMRLVRQPRPVYPPELQAAGVEGTVMLRAIVSKDGTVLQPRVINSVDPRLAKAALDAVAEWRYTPTLLNGQPVETMTTISVEFHLDQ